MVPPGTADAVGRRPLALSLAWHNSMVWLYRALMWCAVLPLLANLWWRGRKDADYRRRWPERFATPHAAATSRDGVVLQCASVGEVLAARPLIELLLADPLFGPLVLTCTTPTGSRMIRQLYGERVVHRYFPLDLPGATRRFLHQLRPRLVLLLEREIWPTFLQQAQLQGVPVVLINARLSERSAKQYRHLAALMRPAITRLRFVCAADGDTLERYAALGLSRQRLRLTGNIKSDVQMDPALATRIGTLHRRFGGRPVLAAGSTHPGEDEALVAAFQRHLPLAPDSLLILVPRHPERFEVVARLLQDSRLRTVRHSLGQAVDASTQVLLGDSMGELMLWYGVADSCFVGGSLIPRGGHNPLEVLCLDKPLLTGRHTANFAPIYAALEAAHAMCRAADADAVFTCWRALLADPAGSAIQVSKARTIYRQMAGASERSMDCLRALLHPARDTQVQRPHHGASAGDAVVWADAELFSAAHTQLFDPAWWRGAGQAQTQGAGRGNIHRVADRGGSYLMRHYYRGGWMARLSRDLFWHQSVAQSRAMREFCLLGALRARGLPVPRAAAARYQRVGLWYRADILVQAIPHAQDVAQLLHQQRSLTPHEWQALGRAVRQLHDAQVWHSDLNCHNLMLDTKGKAWIVDFDKCGFRDGEHWKADNLARLLRSLRKELRLDPSFRWSEAQWQTLLDAYAGDPLLPTKQPVGDSG